jgi:hypothetical protein
MLLPLFLALQQGAVPAPRLDVHPAAPMVVAGDTVRLTGRVLGADGKPVEGSRVRFAIAGASFEGAIDTAGLVTAGAVGRIPVSAIGVVPGRAPIFQRLEVEVVPGPAARVAIEPARERLRLVAGQTLDLAATAYSAAGDRRADRIAWSSARPSVAAVSADGRVTARSAGRTTISARAGEGASAALDVEVLAARLGTLAVAPATAHARQGDVVRFSLAAHDAAGKAIEGLAPTWSIAPGKGVIDAEGNFVGYEPGEYTVTASLAGRSASARVSLAARDVRRTATVVGRAPIAGVATSEVWVHPNGKVAYLGTVLGHDKFYALDISDPAHPVVTDSVGGSMRSVNDLMSTPDGKYLVYTREGAADRKNGIGIASLEDPLHPKEIALFTEGVTSGVHSAFVHHQEKHGTHVYVTNDGTGAMHVVDINDPRNPKGIATWRTERADAGRMLHDIDVQDGLAYLSYWNDGLVVLDVGNGVKGGSPSNPVLVTQLKYDLDALYRNVQAQGKPWVRGTHTAWRRGKYVFVADEVFVLEDLMKLSGGQVSRAYGNLQVIDVSDLERPRAVAWYEPEVGGVHNIWVAGDTLYMGAYDGGFRAFDVSGELRGDLRAQGREIAALMPVAPDGRVANAPMTWGAVVKDGLVFVPDMNSGLWIVRLEPKERPLTP